MIVDHIINVDAASSGIVVIVVGATSHYYDDNYDLASLAINECSNSYTFTPQREHPLHNKRERDPPTHRPNRAVTDRPRRMEKDHGRQKQHS